MNRGCKSCWPRILHRGGREGGGGETCVSLVVPDIKCGVIMCVEVRSFACGVTTFVYQKPG